MFKPTMIPHDLRAKLHWGRGCFCLCEKETTVFSMKVSTNKRLGYNNMVTKDDAIIEYGGPSNGYYIRLLKKQKYPVHLLTFGKGANAYYWGRYKYKQVIDHKYVFLKRVDDGMEIAEAPKINARSNIERKWVKHFKSTNTKFCYEPCTFTLDIGDKSVEYTPDFFLPKENIFLEMKGHGEPSVDARMRTDKVRRLGFNIKIVAGDPTNSAIYF